MKRHYQVIAVVVIVAGCFFGHRWWRTSYCFSRYVHFLDSIPALGPLEASELARHVGRLSNPTSLNFVVDKLESDSRKEKIAAALMIIVWLEVPPGHSDTTKIRVNAAVSVDRLRKTVELIERDGLGSNWDSFLQTMNESIDKLTTREQLSH